MTDSNNKSSYLWQIGNNVYNLSNFAKKHPGGEEYILQSKCTDCTLMFYTHHSVRTVERLESKGNQHRFWAGKSKSKSNFLDLIRHDERYWSMKREVDETLKAHGGPGPEPYIYRYLCAFYISYILSMMLCGLAFSNGSFILTIVCIIASGICGTVIAGFGHNFVHQRIQPYNWLILDTVGFPSKSWRRDHCLNHHMYTNNPELDPEITDWAKVGMYFDMSTTSQNWLTVAHPVLMGVGYWIYSHYSALLKGNNTNVTLWMSFLLPIMLLFVCTGSLLWSFVLFEAVKLVTITWFINIAGLPHVNTEHHEHNGWDGSFNWSEIQIDNNTSYLPEASLLTKFLFAGLNDHLAHHLFPYVDMSKYDLVKEVVERHCETKQGDLGTQLVKRFELLRTGMGG